MDSIRKGEIDDCFLKKSRSCHLQDTGIYLYNNKCADYFFNCYSRNNEVYTRYQLWWIRGACVICGVLVLFTGSSLAYRDDAHINADMTSLLFKSEKAKKRMAVVKYAVSMVIAIVATAWAFQFVSWSFELWPTTPIYKLPLALSRLSIIVSFILMSIYVLIHLIRSVAILKGGEN